MRFFEVGIPHITSGHLVRLPWCLLITCLLAEFREKFASLMSPLRSYLYRCVAVSLVNSAGNIKCSVWLKSSELKAYTK